jgi:hypothetical protein
MAEYEPLKEKIERAFKHHVETDNGMIVGPDRLLERVLKAVSEWLQYDESQWRGGTDSDVAEALRDLRMNQLRD